MYKTETAGSLSFTDKILAALGGYVTTLLLFAVAALIITFTSVSDSTIPVIVLISTIAGVVTAGVMAVKHVTSKGWLSGGIAGITYMVLLYLISCITLGKLTFGTEVLFLLLMGFFAGACGGIFGINVKSSKKRK